MCLKALLFLNTCVLIEYLQDYFHTFEAMRKSTHRLVAASACQMDFLPSASIDLVVCSPPYPMIDMWDQDFTDADPDIGKALQQKNGEEAFIRIHNYLDAVWEELARVLCPGGIACINIGDATRCINGDFKLYANHVEIVQRFCQQGFHLLPTIFWRKVTNAPNKFLGSGMLPAGAYITLEHEHILIFRKGSKRNFETVAAQALRKESAYFWEERNNWFSDAWRCPGESQSMRGLPPRTRSAAYPFEIPYRLINMFSVKEDTVLDPFAGLGTTLLAAIASERNSIHIDTQKTLISASQDRALQAQRFLNTYIQARFQQHQQFIQTRIAQGKAPAYYNPHLSCPVITRQEQDLKIHTVEQIRKESKNTLTAIYKRLVHETSCIELKG